MAKFTYFSKTDSKREPIFTKEFSNRRKAAEWFANLKRLSLKQFLSLFSVPKKS